MFHILSQALQKFIHESIFCTLNELISHKTKWPHQVRYFQNWSPLYDPIVRPTEEDKLIALHSEVANHSDINMHFNI
jgi:hypothetical protein